MGLKDLLNNGAILALAATGAVALAGEAKKRGLYGGGAWGGMNDGGGYDDDDYSYDDFYEQQQYGSQAMSYNDFVGQAIPQYMAQGMSSKDAMRAAAADWRAMTG